MKCDFCILKEVLQPPSNKYENSTSHDEHQNFNFNEFRIRASSRRA